jgi:hypothetical protein
MAHGTSGCTAAGNSQNNKVVQLWQSIQDDMLAKMGRKDAQTCAPTMETCIAASWF